MANTAERPVSSKPAPVTLGVRNGPPVGSTRYHSAAPRVSDNFNSERQMRFADSLFEAMVTSLGDDAFVMVKPLVRPSLSVRASRA